MRGGFERKILLDFFETSGFSSKFTDISDIFTADFKLSKYDDLRDIGRIDGKNLLDTDTVDISTDSHDFIKVSLSFHRNDETPKKLDTLFFTFLDNLMDFDFHTSLYDRGIFCDDSACLDSGDKSRVHGIG